MRRVTVWMPDDITGKLMRLSDIQAIKAFKPSDMEKMFAAFYAQAQKEAQEEMTGGMVISCDCLYETIYDVLDTNSADNLISELERRYAN